MIPNWKKTKAYKDAVKKAKERLDNFNAVRKPYGIEPRDSLAPTWTIRGSGKGFKKQFTDEEASERKKNRKKLSEEEQWFRRDRAYVARQMKEEGVFYHYALNTEQDTPNAPPFGCLCCGYEGSGRTTKEGSTGLHLDHIHGDGGRFRKKQGGLKGFNHILDWCIRNQTEDEDGTIHLPDNIRVACAVCNGNINLDGLCQPLYMENYPNPGSHVGLYGNNYKNAVDEEGNIKWGWKWSIPDQSWIDTNKTYGRTHKVEERKGLNKLLNGKGKSYTSNAKLVQRYNATNPIDRISLTLKENLEIIEDRWNQGRSPRRNRYWLPYDLDIFMRKVMGENPQSGDKGKNKLYKASNGQSNPFYASMFLSFEEAREFVRSLGLKNKKEWRQWIKSGNRPDNIPSRPDTTYDGKGWKGMGDWLGTGAIANHKRKFRSFKDARKYVRSLGLKSVDEYWKWSKSGSRPIDIPATPHQVYKGKFTTYADWCDWETYDPTKHTKRNPKTGKFE